MQQQKKSELILPKNYFSENKQLKFNYLSSDFFSANSLVRYLKNHFLLCIQIFAISDLENFFFAKKIKRL
jgi:hypothetical protein